MVITSILKRKDGATLVVGIVLATIIGQFVSGLTFDLANKISGMDNGGYSGPGWKGAYLYPIVSVLLQIVVLELLVRLYIAANDRLKK